MDRRRWIGWALPLLAGCRAAPDAWDELPAPTDAGARVEVASDVTDRICAGTVARLDAEVERIESELELAATSAPYRVWFLDPERASSICGGDPSCADLRHGAVISADNFNVERQSARELTPLLLGRAGLALPPFFVEGFAGAMAWPTCTYPLVGSDVGSFIELLKESPYVALLAGDLVRHMLATYGTANVFDYLGLLSANSSGHEIDVLYGAYFGTPMFNDAQAASNLGGLFDDRYCAAPEPPPASLGPRRLALQAELDCDSPRVQTNFDRPGEGFVEWTLRSGSGFYRIVGELPEGSRIEIADCSCGSLSSAFRELDPAGEELSGWPQQLRWVGPLDAALELDVEIETPCSVAEQDCAAGHKCLEPELPCQPLSDDPIAVGEACSVAVDEPDPCVSKARCVGEPDANGVVSGRCMQQCNSHDPCDGDELCALSFMVCATPCHDPVVNDCSDPQLTCTHDFNATLCLPPGYAGPFEACEILCAPGLTCAPYFVACDGRCCSPVCDPDLGGADCPAEAPTCLDPFTSEPDNPGWCSNI